MKKKIIALLLAVSCVFCFTLTACGKDKGDGFEFPPIDETEYEYSFDSKGGSAVAGGRLYANEYIPMPSEPERDGYEFTGWYYDEDCTRICPFIYTRMPAHDIVFYAGWTQLVVITFDTDGGTPVDKISGHAGDEISEDVAASIKTTKDGHVFEGWYYDADFIDEFVPGVMPSASITVYAKWRERNGSVNVVINYNNKTANVECKEGDVIDLSKYSEHDVDEYSEFVGWATEENGFILGDKFTVPAYDVTVYDVIRTKKEYAHIKIVASDYNDAYDFYAKKGRYMSAQDSNLDGYVDRMSLVKAADIASFDLVYNGFRDEGGAAFDFGDDVVACDMTLTIDVYSDKLVYEPRVNDKNVLQAYVVTGYTGNSQRLIVPAEYSENNGATVPVIAISKEAFKGKAFVSAVLPDSIQVIQASAFENCASLTAVVFPAQLAELYDSAFKGCTALADVEVNDSVYYFGYKVFEGAPFESSMPAKNGVVCVSGVNPDIKQDILYAYKGASVSLDISSVACVAGGAFENVQGLETVSFAGSVRIIGNAAFRGCSDLINIEAGEGGIQFVQDNAFENCGKLVSFEQGESVAMRSIGASAFKNCSSLESFDFMPNLTSLGESAFEGCSSLVSVNIMIAQANNQIYMPRITSVPARTFYGCSALKQYVVTDYVTAIAPEAFGGCASLKYVDMGLLRPALKTVSENAFTGCVSLKRARVISAGITFANGCFDSACVDGLAIYASKSLLEGYRASMAGSPYVGCLKETEQVAPTVKVNKPSVSAEPSRTFNVVEAAKANSVASDNITAADKLEYTVKVTAGETELKSVDADGAVYDLSKAGVYTVTFTVADEYGNSSEEVSFNIVIAAPSV